MARSAFAHEPEDASHVFQIGGEGLVRGERERGRPQVGFRRRLHEERLLRAEFGFDRVQRPLRIIRGAFSTSRAVRPDRGVVHRLRRDARRLHRIRRRDSRGVVRERREEENLDDDEHDEAQEVLFDALVRVASSRLNVGVVRDAERDDVGGERGDDTRVGVFGVESEVGGEESETRRAG